MESYMRCDARSLQLTASSKTIKPSTLTSGPARMAEFAPLLERACQSLIDLALREDLGDSGDLTTQAFIPVTQTGSATFVARAAGVIAGLPAAALVFRTLDSKAAFKPLVEDSTHVEPGTKLATISGSMRTILIGERTALNFLQRLSGVATKTRQF